MTREEMVFVYVEDLDCIYPEMDARISHQNLFSSGNEV